MLEAPLHQGEGSLPPFGLRDETSSEASHHGSEIPLEEPEGAAFGATSPISLRTEEGAEPTPEPSAQQTPRRVKHMAQRKKFGPRGRFYLIEALPLWCQFPFSSLFGHQAYFPEDLITDLKLLEVYCFVKVLSCSIMVGRPGDLSIISFFLQQI